MSSGSFTTQLFTLTGFAFGCLGHEFLRHITGEQTDFFIQMLDIHGIGNAYIESSYFEIHAETTKLHFGLFSIHSYIFTPDDWSIQWGMRDEDSLEFYIRSAAPFNKHKYKRRKSYHLRSMLLLVALRWIRKTTIVSNSAFSYLHTPKHQQLVIKLVRHPFGSLQVFHIHRIVRKLHVIISITPLIQEYFRR